MAEAPDAPWDELESIVKAANTDEPREATLVKLQGLLAEHPVAALITERLAVEAVAGQMSAGEGDRCLVNSAYLEMCGRLGEDGSSDLEKVVIRHLVICWLRLQDMERRYSTVTAQPGNITTLDFWERRLCATQRRFLRAVEALNRIRKVPLSLQVNVGDKQVNVGG